MDKSIQSFFYPLDDYARAAADCISNKGFEACGKQVLQNNTVQTLLTTAVALGVIAAMVKITRTPVPIQFDKNNAELHIRLNRGDHTEAIEYFKQRFGFISNEVDAVLPLHLKRDYYGTRFKLLELLEPLTLFEEYISRVDNQPFTPQDKQEIAAYLNHYKQI